MLAMKTAEFKDLIHQINNEQIIEEVATMRIRKTLIPDGIELEKILKHHRKALEQCNIPEDDDVYKILEECEVNIVRSINDLVDEAFHRGIAEDNL